MAIRSSISGHEVRRVGKFGIVGILNTLIDFVIYNLLSSRLMLSLVESNIISTTIAMAFSFIANKQLVFKRRDGSFAKQAMVFFLVSAFGLYVLQTGTIKILTDYWLAPVHLGLWLAHSLGVTGHDAFLIKNIAKGFATIISLTWNYIMYKKVVFK